MALRPRPLEVNRAKSAARWLTHVAAIPETPLPTIATLIAVVTGFLVVYDTRSASTRICRKSRTLPDVMAFVTTGHQDCYPEAYFPTVSAPVLAPLQDRPSGAKIEWNAPTKTLKTSTQVSYRRCLQSWRLTGGLRTIVQVTMTCCDNPNGCCKSASSSSPNSVPLPSKKHAPSDPSDPASKATNPSDPVWYLDNPTPAPATRRAQLDNLLATEQPLGSKCGVHEDGEGRGTCCKDLKGEDERHLISPEIVRDV